MKNFVSREVSELLHAAPRGAATGLALACGVSSATVTKWKKRETAPDPSHWETIEQYFDLEPGSLSRLDENGGSLAQAVDQIQSTIDRAQRELDEVRRALGLLRQD